MRQNAIEQDLAGDDSLIGRSIGLYEKDDDKVLACCVIAVDTYRDYAAYEKEEEDEGQQTDSEPSDD